MVHATVPPPFPSSGCHQRSALCNTALNQFAHVLQGADAKTAYQIIHDELTLDGAPNLNLASFVHTWMPDEANKLMMENLSKNLIDQDEYPITREYNVYFNESASHVLGVQKSFTLDVCVFKAQPDEVKY